MKRALNLTLLLLCSCTVQEFVVGSGMEVSERLSVSQFRAEWSTPNTIRWAWDTAGQPQSFEGFRLVLAPTQAEVESTAAARRIITATENVELSNWTLPGSVGPARTLGTTSTEHPPASTWFARLEWSSDGEPAVSNTASIATTTSPSEQLVIFQDSAASPYTIPDTFALGSAGPYAGSSDYEYSSDCSGADACWENLRFSGMDFDLSSVPAAAIARDGYLEFALAYEGSTPSYWSECFMQLTGCMPCRYGFVGWAIPGDGQYRVYQVPLSALESGGQPFSVADWQSGLNELRIGGRWAQAGFVRLDQVSLRW